MGGRRGEVVEPTPTPAGLRPGVLLGWEGEAATDPPLQQPEMVEGC